MRTISGTASVSVMTRIVILGAGTGGTLTANRLRRLHGDDAEIVVVDRDDRHVYQPGLLFMPFRLTDPESIVRSRSAQLHDGIEFRLADVDRVDVNDNRQPQLFGVREPSGWGTSTREWLGDATNEAHGRVALTRR